jgi:hypothetical protein
MRTKPIQAQLIAPFPPVVGETLIAHREADGVRLCTSVVIAVQPHGNGHWLVETRHSRYLVRVAHTASP